MNRPDRLRHRIVPCLLLSAAFALRAIQIADTQLPVGVLSEPYPAFQLTGTNGTAPYTWALASGPLPPGITLQTTGALTGTPTAAGAYPVTFQVTGAGGAQATKAFTFTIANPPASGGALWERRGLIAGNISEIDISPNYATDNTLFARGVGPELFRSVDRGLNWTRHLIPSSVLAGYSSVGPVNLSPSFKYTTNPAAQPEAEKTVFVTLNRVLYKSVNHGQTYGAVRCDGVAVQCLNYALSPQYATDGRIYVFQCNGDAYGCTYGAPYSLYRSADRGASWALVKQFDPDLGVIFGNLALSPAFSTDLTMFAHFTLTSLNASRVYKSTDGGVNWSQLPALPGVDSLYQIGLSPNYATDQTLFLRPYGSGVNYLYKSTNGGAAWSTVSNPLISDRFTEFDWIARPAQTPLLAFYSHHAPAGRYSVLVSDDYGVTFVPRFTGQIRTSDSFGSFGFAASPPLAGGLIDVFLGSTSGIDGSTDGGFSFVPREKGVDAAWTGGWGLGRGGAYTGFTTIATNGWYKSADAGVSFVRMPGVAAGGPVGAYSVTPYFPPNYDLDRTVFLSYAGDLYRSTDGGASSTLVGDNFGVQDIAFAPNFRAASGTMFLATSTGLRKSVDGGLTYSALSSANPNCLFTATDYTSVIEISPSYAGDQALFTIDSNGTQSLCKSRDGGATWTRVNGPYVNFIDFTLSPVYDDRAAAGTPQRMIYTAGQNSIGAEPMRSTDGGVTFAVVGGVPAGLNSSRPFPSPAFTLDSTVLLATSAGMYRSADYGATFARLGGGDQLSYRSPISVYFAPGFDGRLTANSAAVALTAGSGIWRSTDGGRAFLPSGGGSTVSTRINQLAPIATSGGVPRILAAAEDHGMLQSDDGGLTFANISKGLPADSDMRAVVAPALQPARPVAARNADGLWRYDGATTTWIRHPGAGIGDYRGFGEDGTYLYAMRRDGVSLRSADGGATWTAQDAARTDLVAVSSGAGGAAIVGDGDFEQPYIAGALTTVAAPGTIGPWTVESGSVDHIGTYWQAADGRQSLDMSGGAAGAIRQDLITIPGATYTLRFSLAANPADVGPCAGTGAVKTLQVWWNGALLAQVAADRTGRTTGAMGWSPRQFTAVATAATTRIRFVSLENSACGPALDAVSVTRQTPLADPSGGKPSMVDAVTASLWSVSAAQGPMFSYDNGAHWTAAPGGNDYALPIGQIYSIVIAIGINATSGGREVLAGSTTGLYKSTDGGETWRRADGAGSGLELTARNYSAVLSAPTAYGTTDLLVGVTGTTTGGVYLSGDGGEHWTQINQGFDPNNLSISSLVKTSCAGCPVQYYTGTYGSGVYTRTIAVNAPPAFPVANYACFGSTGCACATTGGSGPEQGGQAFKLCGSGFANGVTVEFDGVPASGCGQTGGTVITCTGTPPHVPGSAVIRVRNADTRTGTLPAAYTYTGGASRASSLKLAKSGADAWVSWSCASCTVGAPARLYRGQNAGLTLYPEIYAGGASGTQTGGCTSAAGTTSCHNQTGAVSSAQSYFWSVE